MVENRKLKNFHLIKKMKLKTTQTTKVIDYIEFDGSLDELESSINLINVNTPDNVVLTYEILED